MKRTEVYSRTRDVGADGQLPGAPRPYRFTRNPMYLAGLGLWLGWAVFYGRLPVLAGAALWAATNSVIITREERALNRVFGEEYHLYKRSVPRWLHNFSRD